MVASSHPTVTATAVEVLRSGGNAVDAVLTAIPLQQVLEPQLSTIGGGFGMLHWDAATRTAVYLNANPDRPAALRATPTGGADTCGDRVGVPGTVAGLRAAAERFGTRSWSSYFAPALAAAEDGYEMYPGVHRAIVEARDRLAHHSGGRERYLRDGRPPAIGQMFHQPALARTLSRIAEPDGAEWFQQGPFADHFVDAVRGTGGVLTMRDLADYRPQWRSPLRALHRGHELLGPAWPDTGGLYWAVALSLIERIGLSPSQTWLTSARDLAVIARAQAVADRLSWDGGSAGSPDHDSVEAMVPSDHLDRLATEIAAQLSRRTGEAHPSAPAPAAPRPRSGGRTTGSNQLVVVDPDGSWVTVLHTGYGTDFGTGLVVDGVGMNAANLFPADPSGRRIVAPLGSTLVLHEGRPRIGLGTPGLPPPFVTLVLLGLLDYGLDLHEAVDAPRFVLDAEAGDLLAVESRVPQATLDGLTSVGLGTRLLGSRDRAVGRMQAVLREHPTGRLVGVVDARGGGAAAGW